MEGVHHEDRGKNEKEAQGCDGIKNNQDEGEGWEADDEDSRVTDQVRSDDINDRDDFPERALFDWFWLFSHFII